MKNIVQESVLGPISYILFTADLSIDMETTKLLFADDTALLAIDTNPAEASRKLQSALNNIEIWL